MAITLADFTKIWASTSPLTPYSFSESNYKEGWNFVGSTPPARQMWDSIQKQNDEKMEYIVDNFLPLTGGTMTGDIALNSAMIKNFASDTSTTVCGGTADNNYGAFLRLNGKDNSSAGLWTLRADDGANASSLVGYPNGTLTWNGKEVERVNASGSDYIRFESGLQICWGGTSNITTATTVTVNLPVAFVNDGYIVAIGRWWVASAGEEYYVHDSITTSFKLTTIGSVGGGAHGYKYIATGKWK